MTLVKTKGIWVLEMFQTETLGSAGLKPWKSSKNGKDSADRRYRISKGENPSGLFSHLIPQNETDLSIIAPAATESDSSLSIILINQ